MVQLNDLSDDCLMEVLERVSLNQLFKLQRLNQRMKRLAVIKMGVKIKAIALKKSYYRFRGFSSCSHLDSSIPDKNQVLVIDPKIKKECRFDTYGPIILSLLSKCAGVKSVDFGFCLLPSGLLLEAFRRCPELECVKLFQLFVKQDEWDRVLDEIGQRIVHLAIYWRINKPDYLPSHLFLKTVAAKCNHIKRVDWAIKGRPTSDLMGTFKLLPKNCWISLACSRLEAGAFEDVIDMFICFTLKWSQLGKRYNRLSKLKFNCVEGPIHEVVFAGLKQLDFKVSCQYNSEPINYLLLSRFPMLEVFCFNASAYLTKDHFEAVFQQMTTIKVLVINCGKDWFMYDYPKMPQSTAIQMLKNLKIIYLIIFDVHDNWQPNNFLQQVEQCVDEVSSLKKLAIDNRFCKNDVWRAAVEDLIKRLKLKQSRVEVVLNVKLKC